MLLVRSLGPSHLREDTLPWPQETQAACLPLPGGGPRRLPPSSTEGRSPSPTDYPCQAQCQLTRSQSGPERQVPGLSVGCLEAPVPSSSAVGLRSAGRSVPNTREGSGQKQDRAECKKKPESAQQGAPEQTCPPPPPPKLSHVSRNQPGPCTRLAHSPDAATRGGPRCAEAPGGWLHPTSLGSPVFLEGSSGRCMPADSTAELPRPSGEKTDTETGASVPWGCTTTWCDASVPGWQAQSSGPILYTLLPHGCHAFK